MSTKKTSVVLAQDALRCKRHFDRVTNEMKGLVNSSVSDDLDEIKDMREHCKRLYENLDTLYTHFIKCYQEFVDDYRVADETTDAAQRVYDTLADFHLDAPLTMNALRVRIERLNEEISNNGSLSNLSAAVSDSRDARRVQNEAHQSSQSVPITNYYTPISPIASPVHTKRSAMSLQPRKLRDDFDIRIVKKDVSTPLSPPESVHENTDHRNQAQDEERSEDILLVPSKLLMKESPISAPKFPLNVPADQGGQNTSATAATVPNHHNPQPPPWMLQDAQPRFPLRPQPLPVMWRIPPPVLMSQQNDTSTKMQLGTMNQQFPQQQLLNVHHSNPDGNCDRQRFNEPTGSPIPTFPQFPTDATSPRHTSTLQNSAREPNCRPSWMHLAEPPPQTQQQRQSSDDLGQLVMMLAEALKMNQNQQQSRSRVELPKMQLEQFGGEYNQFQPWWDKFERLVDQNSSLSDIEKLSFLVSAVRDKAEMLIKHLRITNENYRVAVHILKSAFGNPRIAIETTESKIYNIRPVGKFETGRLTEFFYELESHVGSLESLGCDTDKFVSVLLKKLPIGLVTTLERSKGLEQPWNMKLLRQTLKREIDIREAGYRMAVGKHPSEKEQRNSQQSKFHSSTDAFQANAEPTRRFNNNQSWKQRNNQQKTNLRQTNTGCESQSSHKNTPMVYCVFCKERHWSSQCGKVMTGNERKQSLRKQERCFACLKVGHKTTQCIQKKSCYYCKEVGKHHSCICPTKFGASTKSEQSHAADEDQDDKVHDLTSKQTQSQLADDERTLMKTAVMTVVNPEDPAKTMKVRAFFDSGTSRTFITERLANKLSLKVKSEQVLRIRRFGQENEGPLMDRTKMAPLDLIDLKGEKWRINATISKKTLHSMNKASLPMEVFKRLPKDVRLADNTSSVNETVDVDLMVGNDHYDDFVNGAKISLGDGFWLIDSIFGWIASGRMQDDSTDDEQITASLILIDSGSSVKQDLERMESETSIKLEDIWNLDTIGIQENEEDENDQWAIAKFNDTVRFTDGRYEIAWPFMNNIIELPTNRSIASRRLHGLLARSKAQNRLEFLQRYDNIMQEQLNNGILEEVPKDKRPAGPVHYLAHHAVEKPQALTTKLRVVYDASAREDKTKPSLNQCLFRGQVILKNLVTLLLRFRLWPIGIVCDVEKAFLQIAIRDQDRDVTRLLWVKDFRKPPTPSNIIEYRFRRVPFGVKTSPFLLGATLTHHLRKEGSELAKKIEENLYVDNIVTGVEDVEEAAEFYKGTKEMFGRASMNLRAYTTNSNEFNKTIPDEDRVQDETVKILGVKWSTSKDTFQFNDQHLDATMPTKRLILSYLYQLFDPLGFFSPVTIRGKVLLQALTKTKMKWNEQIGPSNESLWREIAQDMSNLHSVQVPRYIGFDKSKPRRLLAFCDASKLAYSAVVYLQFPLKDQNYNSNLIMSRARVAPMKELSIPRLELMSMLITVRLVNFVRNSLHFDGEIIIFTDSTCVLHWIRSSKYLGTFVDNRLREIRKSPGIEFRYVPTTDNPADQATRGVRLSSLNCFWWNGPEWCTKDKTYWPNCDFEISITPTEEISDETQPTPRISEIACVAQEMRLQYHLMNPDNYSSWRRLVRITAWCRRFVIQTRKFRRAKYNTILDRCPATKNNLTPDEVNQGIKFWVRQVQEKFFPEVFIALKKGSPNPIQKQLGIQADDEGLLRCHGRFANIEGDENTKYPLLLPTKSRLTTMIIEEVHRRSIHAGAEHTLGILRQHYWVPRGRARVKSILHSCVTCRKNQGGFFSRPPMPDLPKARVTRNVPFTHIGLDNFGPLLVKTETGVQKRWVTMLTCLTVRAIHLELVNNQSAEEFLMAMRRFVAKRGKPRSIVCDNATQFKAIRAADPFSEFLSGERIKWFFIPELSPWAGGVYERLIQIIKASLRKSIGKKMLNQQQLLTVLAEVESCVNSRPLTHVSDNVNDFNVLSPNDFLGIAIEAVDVPTGRNDRDYHDQTASTREKLIQLFKETQVEVNNFWELWNREYLLNMRERTTWMHRDPRGSLRNTPQVGQVVLLKEQPIPRCRWKLGLVDHLLPGHDEFIRAVKVKLANGKLLVRPVNLLAPLECDVIKGPDEKRHETEKTVKKRLKITEKTNTSCDNEDILDGGMSPSKNSSSSFSHHVAPPQPAVIAPKQQFQPVDKTVEFQTHPAENRKEINSDNTPKPPKSESRIAGKPMDPQPRYDGAPTESQPRLPKRQRRAAKIANAKIRQIFDDYCD